MDNIQEKISKIMADPEALKEVQNLGKMLGIGENKQSLGNLSSLINKEPPVPATPQIPTEVMGKIAKLMPIIQQVNQEDDVSRLLQALRPFLSDEKCHKLESAKKLLQVMKILPLLKEGGLLEIGLF